MQFAISDAAAILFAEELYTNLDRASARRSTPRSSEARKAIFIEQGTVEWATPVLFMAATDVELWRWAPAAAADRWTRRSAAARPLPVGRAALAAPTRRRRRASSCSLPASRRGPCCGPTAILVRVPIADDGRSRRSSHRRRSPPTPVVDGRPAPRRPSRRRRSPGRSTRRARPTRSRSRASPASRCTSTARRRAARASRTGSSARRARSTAATPTSARTSGASTWRSPGRGRWRSRPTPAARVPMPSS